MVGVFAVSSVNGVSGLIEGNIRQFGIQLLAGVDAAFAFGVTWLILKIMNHFSPVRVPDAVEVNGLDEGQFGEQAYTLKYPTYQYWPEFSYVNCRRTLVFIL